ncbi:ester cyclase [Mycobacterium sp. Aquia_213]|uniref:ester cyclase n=1 Tax=Mycobacterium sp. Aquia_213 TaxID=2991728 RepID=UPI00226EA2A2|nr:nuclear transport factor 2 family protein [Mycobacterium sp. Aquia_213]WAC90175.1 ester cyclase [Mycobacterium sp. Aquia_213]
MTTITGSGQFTINAAADRIESNEWLRGFIDRYIAAWSLKDGAAVSTCMTEDAIWHEPTTAKPVEGRCRVADFVSETVRTFPDICHSNPFPPVITADAKAALVPWRITGTHLGVIDPPGFAGTGKTIDVFAIDIWQFRSGLIWRGQSIWNLAEMLQQLGIMPARGSAAERALARAQRWRSKVGL